MASYKSQYGPPRRIEDNTPTTRLPKRSITPTTIASQLPTSSSQSKLQKRRPSRDEPAQSERTLSNQKDLARKVISYQASSTAAPSTIQASGSTSYKTRSTRSTSSSSRLPKLEVPVNTRTPSQTPSLVSGSSASTIESPRSNVLRRKQPSVGVASSRHALRTRDDSMSSQEGAQHAEHNSTGFKDPFTESVFGISLPPSSTILARSEPELESPQNGLYDDIGPLDIYPVPTPQYAISATPSTRYTDSPGAFSVSSAATSMTSYSPATALSKASYGRVRQVSPLESRPPVSRYRAPEEPSVRAAHGLSTVRESSTSSSSVSTVVADAGKAGLTKKQLPAVPQSPPVLNPTPTVQTRPRVQPVPELAHLADPSPVSPPSSRRPSRPSRDGTPEIHGLRDPSPVIQSNMVSFPTHHRRTSSTESKFGSLSVARPRMAVAVKASSRNPSPVPTSSIPSTSIALKRGVTPDNQKRDTNRSSTLPAPVPAPSPSKRFGFFSRRTKTDPAPHASKSESKLVRKGPAAGTGHEGYGRHASRGRSSSSIGASIGRSASAGTTSESLTQTPSTRKSSMTSTTSGEMDDFFLNRLNPVILRGAGSSSELTRSPEPMNSSSSLDIATRPKLPLGNTTSITAEPVNEKNKPRLLPSAMPNTMRSVSPAKKTIRRPSESDDDTKRSFLPTLASRRTSRTVKPAEGVLSPPGRRSTSKSRKDSANDEGSWLRSSKKNKADKEKPKPSKWNFFSRAHAAAPRVETPATQESATPSSPGLGSRSVAHYALMDAQSNLNMEDIEQLMKEAAGNTDTESVLSDNDSMRKERMQSMLLPPKPILPAFAPPSRPASPKVVLRSDQLPQRYANLTVDTDVQPVPEPSLRHSQAGTIFDLSPPSSPVTQQQPIQDDDAPEIAPKPIDSEPPQQVEPLVKSLPPPAPAPTSPPPRPSRLPQVGRIPQVVSSRGKPRRPSSRSFSRPFATDQPRPTALPRTSFDSIAGSMTATAGPVEPFPILRGLDALSHGTAIASISPFSDESRQSEFFKFPPRKDSEVSYSSSSGVWSFAPVAGTAVIPPPEAPLSDDELWNEYDDLLDQVVSPGGTVRKVVTPKKQPSLEPPPLNTKTSCVSILSGTSEMKESVPSVHIRRSRLLAALYAQQSPTSSMALSDVINDYGDRKLSVVDSNTGRLSLPLSPTLSGTSAQRRSTWASLPPSSPIADRRSKATIASRSDKDRNSLPASRYRDTGLMDAAEARAFGHASMADLRFGALMTSKWLSFGRVLFSPVHPQLIKGNVEDDRVLVIDGTGKDWSFYCALTYENAAVYDLGPSPSSPANRKSGLSNHRHIRHTSLTHALPYPQNFFACVVLRFPSAQPSTTHNFLLSEAKRVLRPGGYLEFSVLDLDLVNMGNRARKAVRELKMDIHRVDDSISLRNISDEIIAGLGRKRFVECKSCVVGVPVAGNLPTPQDVNHPMRKNSVSSRKRADSNLQPSKMAKTEPSFSDLLNTSTPSESTDKGIAEKVARVGRWWYSRCYESIVLPDAEGPDGALPSDILKNSIWRDSKLVSECEELGTSFRLLIGYAQKPEVGVRRTVSV